MLEPGLALHDRGVATASGAPLRHGAHEVAAVHVVLGTHGGRERRTRCGRRTLPPNPSFLLRPGSPCFDDCRRHGAWRPQFLGNVTTPARKTKMGVMSQIRVIRSLNGC